MRTRIPRWLLLLALLIAGCAARPAAPVRNSSPAEAPAFPVTVTDDAGRTVTFDQAPRRIVSLSPGHTETLYALGLGDRVIMTDTYSDYPAENQPKAKLNTWPRPNLEELVSLSPDLVLVLVEGDEVIRGLEAHRIPVLKLFPQSFDEALDHIRLLGRVTGAMPAATRITDDMRRRAEAVAEKVKGLPTPRVMYELDGSDPARPWVSGPGGFHGDIIPRAGGEHIFADLDQPAAQVSTEQIIDKDPEIIILGDADAPYNPQTPEMVRARSGWDRITAVRTDRIYPLDGDYLSRPGPRLVEGLEQMARLLHPEAFE